MNITQKRDMDALGVDYDHDRNGFYRKNEPDEILCRPVFCRAGGCTVLDWRQTLKVIEWHLGLVKKPLYDLDHILAESRAVCV